MQRRDAGSVLDYASETLWKNRRNLQTLRWWKGETQREVNSVDDSEILTENTII